MGDKKIDIRKRELRHHFIDVRRELGAEARAAADAAIASRVTSLAEYADASAVLTYLSIWDEVETRGIIRDAWSRGKGVALPRCVPHTRLMRWYRVESLDGLERSKFGVLEPVADPATELDPNAAPNALAIVPGLTFDARGYRLGYGGGFYDTFLAGFGGASVGICREAQLSAAGELALDAHDLPVQVVVTEAQVIRVN
ncbi:MAG: 5-formyltetrahydrofolate cyclo-ligase [Olsenella sp.]|jgi:5-formyltetrahydrofolate cyclo-ligase|nr:5-formyltetrahydrofolate cyclo-ligase [Olsenella sp.]MCI1289761.1 5-formyltetrahydrofolate cyclo-ligase [Olsenella sp.]